MFAIEFFTVNTNLPEMAIFAAKYLPPVRLLNLIIKKSETFRSLYNHALLNSVVHDKSV